jgi:hypothetical protein
VNPEEVTAQILGAWDEVQEQDAPAAVAEEEPVEEEPVEGAEEETPAEEEEAEDAPADEDEESAENEGDDEEEVTAEEMVEIVLSKDPMFRAWLDRYQGDPQKALEGAFQLEKVLGRQGQEKAVLTRRVQELETALRDAASYQEGPSILSPEQRDWVAEALESGSPASYVREAVRAGEFGLARAVTSMWGQEQPFDALRAAQAVDQAEAQAHQAAQQVDVSEPVNVATMLDVLVEHFPDMPQYEAEMVQTMNRLGPNHHSVLEARSGDPETAARGIINLYEIARATSATLAKTKQELRNGSREEAASKRKKAVVSSAEASPSSSEAPRSQRLGPGLTLAALEEEWERNT